MSSLITTVIVVVVLVVVLGGGVLACALGWNRIMPGWSRKSKKQEQWPSEKYPFPSRSSVETDWVGSPISSPASSPVASPRASRQSSDITIKHGRQSSMQENV
ncbi:hypothetical protein BKA67DRAFT_535297 [Truncatella angustata]|uniref:Uncharacterized protein n=1 Tax=Truncatella angustata TaxID=152316 RepID=A0A9P8UKU1_9PEZI|nr:uncharacterized protein BKA67DRAFT_535297 [Truncatella angustata]KAH6653949.1 hypothetical protein BKA67DRAFT_535297 [Truncatella angustata]